jgi:hypothetical protein
MKMRQWLDTLSNIIGSIAGIMGGLFLLVVGLGPIIYGLFTHHTEISNGNLSTPALPHVPIPTGYTVPIKDILLFVAWFRGGTTAMTLGAGLLIPA